MREKFATARKTIEEGIAEKVIENGMARLMAAFQAMIKDADVTNGDVFRYIARLSFTTFGLPATEMAGFVEVSKSAVSKWVHDGALPPIAVRRKALEWINGELEKRLEAAPLDTPRRTSVARSILGVPARRAVGGPSPRR